MALSLLIPRWYGKGNIVQFCKRGTSDSNASRLHFRGKIFLLLKKKINTNSQAKNTVRKTKQCIFKITVTYLLWAS